MGPLSTQDLLSSSSENYWKTNHSSLRFCGLTIRDSKKSNEIKELNDLSQGKSDPMCLASSMSGMGPAKT